jgi:hypothetical protein
MVYFGPLQTAHIRFQSRPEVDTAAKVSLSGSGRVDMVECTHAGETMCAYHLSGWTSGEGPAAADGGGTRGGGEGWWGGGGNVNSHRHVSKVDFKKIEVVVVAVGHGCAASWRPQSGPLVCIRLSPVVTPVPSARSAVDVGWEAGRWWVTLISLQGPCSL